MTGGPEVSKQDIMIASEPLGGGKQVETTEYDEDAPF